MLPTAATTWRVSLLAVRNSRGEASCDPARCSS
jgi:hypothetical protein